MRTNKEDISGASYGIVWRQESTNTLPNSNENAHMEFLDSPSTTSEIEYSINFASGADGTTVMVGQGLFQYIFAMEIDGT